MKLKPIGVIKSPYKKREDAPRQGRYSKKLSKITVFDDYLEGLQDIERHKYYYVFYWLDKAERDKLKGIPPGKTEERGVFSIRSPIRPNPIALCLVELVKIEKNILTVKWLDALDGSPLLDIKPFWPETDCI
ncbi:tRNA (N6-threonylcarbamoyladenosine(37)-N6)-methyltransferase TrmO [Methanobacterium oryzae]|uniref:tRNA (N6-threonylcarbamoyladenosine(37)-N6)-methyltransferase TrmO n=1 Tax=Methanobacterium oryzae TaxID=69540 RepID=UPI003D199208